jgi:hypothetical protein
VYGQVKNYSAALDDWNNFIRLATDDPVGYGERAKVKTALGDQAGAKGDQDEFARLTAPANNTAPPNQQAGVPARTPRGGNTAQPAAGNPAATAPFPQRWSLLQYNKLFTMRMVGNHLYMQSTDNVIVADAEQTADKKGAVVFKGKWRQKNANGTFSNWNMTLKTVSPERIDGTVLTLVFTGEPVTFVPQ